MPSLYRMSAQRKLEAFDASPVPSFAFFDALREAYLNQMFARCWFPALDRPDAWKELSLLDFLAPSSWLPLQMIQAIQRHEGPLPDELDVPHLAFFAVGDHPETQHMGVTLIDGAAPQADAWGTFLADALKGLSTQPLHDLDWAHSEYATGDLYLVNVRRLLGPEVVQAFGMTQRYPTLDSVWGAPWEDHTVIQDDEGAPARTSVRLKLDTAAKAVWLSTNLNRVYWSKTSATSATPQ